MMMVRILLQKILYTEKEINTRMMLIKMMIHTNQKKDRVIEQRIIQGKILMQKKMRILMQKKMKVLMQKKTKVLMQKKMRILIQKKNQTEQEIHTRVMLIKRMTQFVS